MSAGSGTARCNGTRRPDRNEAALEALSADYEHWIAQQQWPDGVYVGSADEMLTQAWLTPEQRRWLSNYCIEWERVEQFVEAAPKNWVNGPFGHTYYMKGASLVGSPTNAKGALPFDMDVETAVDEFVEPLTPSARATIDEALAIANMAVHLRVTVDTRASFGVDSGPEYLIAVECDGTAVVDPFVEEAGRWEVDPEEAYGIPREAAEAIRANNLGGRGTGKDERT